MKYILHKSEEKKLLGLVSTSEHTFVHRKDIWLIRGQTSYN